MNLQFFNETVRNCLILFISELLIYTYYNAEWCYQAMLHVDPTVNFVIVFFYLCDK